MQFGNGTQVNAAPGFFSSLPAIYGSKSPWSVIEWNKGQYLDPTQMSQNAPSTYDPLLGNATYSWATPDGESSLYIYGNGTTTPWVYDLRSSGGSLTAGGGSNVFLSDGAIAPNATFDKMITYQLTAKISEALVSYNTAAASTNGIVLAQAFTGFTLWFNEPGTTGFLSTLPSFSVFLQIPITGSNGPASATDYRGASPLTGMNGLTLVYGHVLAGDGTLPFAASTGAPVALTYNLNAYLSDLIAQPWPVANANGSTSWVWLPSAVDNFSEWTLTSAYVGLETQNSDGRPGANPAPQGTAALGLQISDLQISRDTTTSESIASFNSQPRDSGLNVSQIESYAAWQQSQTSPPTSPPPVLQPVITVSSSATVAVARVGAIRGISLSETGNKTGETFSVTLSDAHGSLSTANAGGATIAGANTTSLTLSGSLSAVGVALANVTDTDATAGVETITVIASDSLGNVASKQTIAVTVNGLPTLTVPGALTLGAATATSIAGVSVAETGNTAGETFSVTLSDVYGLLSVGNAAGATVGGSGSTSMSVSGTLAQVNTALASLRDIDATAGTDTISVNATDSLGSTAKKATVAVAAVGQMVLTAPTALALGVTRMSVIGGASVSEIGNIAGETFSVTLADTHGLLSTAITGGAAISGANTTSLTLSGSLSAINAALANLTDTDGTAGTETITLSGSDSVGRVASKLTVGVTVNGLPTLSVPGSMTLSTSGVSAITGVSVAESGNTSGETFSVTLTDAHGLLSVSSSGGATVTGAGSASMKLSGSLAQVNAALATLHDADATVGTDTITLNAADSRGNTATKAAIAVTATTQPVFTAPASVILAVSRPGAIAGVSVAESGVTAGETFSVKLQDTHGLLSTSNAGGATVAGANTTSLTLGGSLAAIDTALANLTDTDPTPGSENITLTGSDSLGNAAKSQTIAVTTNGLPTIAATPPLTIGTAVATAITGIGVAETGNTAGETFAATVSDLHGLLTVSNAGGSTVTGSGSVSVNVSGSLTQVNAALGSLSDTDAAAGADTITLNVTDSFGNAANKATIGVSANAAPVLAAQAAATFGVARAGTIAGTSISETGNTGGEIFTVTLADAHGLLSTGNAGGATVGGANTTSLTLSGSLAAVNGALANLIDTDATPGADAIALSGSDSLGNAAIGRTIAVTVNGAPTLTVPGPLSIAVGTATAITGISVAEAGVTTNETFTAQLTDGNGALAASGAGGAVIAGAQSNALQIRGSLAQVNAALATVTDTTYSTVADPIAVAVTDGFGNVSAAASIGVTVPGGGAQVYTLTSQADTVTPPAGQNNNTVVAGSGTLGQGDIIDLSATSGNTLSLQGGGTFDLTAPATLAGIATIQAQEGQSAYSANGQSYTATDQAVYLRDGLTALVDVASATPTPGNPTPEGITIVGANDADTIDLGSGRDTVTLGSASETVGGGSGADSFIVTWETIDATIDGGPSGSSGLIVTGGGVLAMGTNITDIQSVTLTDSSGPDYDFTANDIPGLLISTSTGSDIINTGAGGDTVLVNSPNVTVNGNGDDTFDVTAATIGATITGNLWGDNTLAVTSPGTMTMGDNITNMANVDLEGGTTGYAGYTFVANDTAYLNIVGSQGNDTITVGDPSQSVEVFGNSTTIDASAANAGVLVTSGASAANATLEISGGGVAVLNDDDAQGLVVNLDQATVLLMGQASFITAVAETPGSRIFAGPTSQTLETLQGGDILYSGNAGASSSDKFEGTGAGLDQDTIANFTSNDVIDITDLVPSAGVTYSQTTPSEGTLTFAGHSVMLAGQFTANLFQVTSDGQNGTLVRYT